MEESYTTLFFFFLHPKQKNKWRLRARFEESRVYRLFLRLLALREGQADGVLLSQGGQLLEELAEDDGTVDGVLHPQRLGLFLQARRPSASAAPEQSAVQWLAAVPYVCEGQLSGVTSPGGTVGVAEDQFSQRWLTTLHWRSKTSGLRVVTFKNNFNKNSFYAADSSFSCFLMYGLPKSREHNHLVLKKSLKIILKIHICTC